VHRHDFSECSARHAAVDAFEQIEATWVQVGLCLVAVLATASASPAGRESAVPLPAAGELVASRAVVRAAPSPHARPEYPSHSRETVEARLAELREALVRAGVKLALGTNAENYLDEAFVRGLGTPEARLLGAGRYVLVELPYTSPVPALTDILFRIRLKGVTPVLAHPERCLEFERPGRAAEAVRREPPVDPDLLQAVEECLPQPDSRLRSPDYWHTRRSSRADRR